ncbi:MAG: sugar ABC transporter permease [Chloroflexota bacterium]
MAPPASGLNRRRLALGAGRLALAAAIAAAVFVGLGLVRDPDGPANLYAFLLDLLGQSTVAAGLRDDGIDPLHAKLTIMVIALAIGVGGVWALFAGLNSLVDLLGQTWSRRIRPYMFIGPAVFMLLVYLVVPAVATIVASFTEKGAPEKTWGYVLTSPEMWMAFRNNLIWMVVGTAGSVGIGLAVAALFDRIKREALAKVFIFLPLAISMVGASVIWRFMYAWQPEGETQIGLVNAAWTALGNEPVALMQVSSPPVNTMALIVIMIWLQTGFAMVILSAALKGVPSEVLEAARSDGANERQVFFRIVLPMIRGTLIAVATTVSIAILKVFDIVYVMTGGRFETEVIANRMFTEMFQFRNFGRASAIAVVLFVAVVPIMYVNIRNLRRQGIGK